MQATVFGGEGILSEMPAALYLESGILGERRLPDGDDCSAARFDIFILVFLFRRDFSQVIVRLNSPQSHQRRSSRLISALRYC